MATGLTLFCIFSLWQVGKVNEAELFYQAELWIVQGSCNSSQVEVSEEKDKWPPTVFHYFCRWDNPKLVTVSIPQFGLILLETSMASGEK